MEIPLKTDSFNRLSRVLENCTITGVLKSLSLELTEKPADDVIEIGESEEEEDDP